MGAFNEYLVAPDPADARLTRRVAGVDQDGAPVETSVTVERPLTLFLNSREIVTMMTVGDYPDCLALGFLVNQNMLAPEDEVTGVEDEGARFGAQSPRIDAEAVEQVQRCGKQRAARQRQLQRPVAARAAS